MSQRNVDRGDSKPIRPNTSQLIPNQGCSPDSQTPKEHGSFWVYFGGCRFLSGKGPQTAGASRRGCAPGTLAVPVDGRAYGGLPPGKGEAVLVEPPILEGEGIAPVRAGGEAPFIVTAEPDRLLHGDEVKLPS